MPIENPSSSNHGTRTFSLDSLTAALEQVQALHEISADLIAENVFGQPAEHGQGEPIILTAVATLEEDGDGGLEPNWLLEGGTAELLAGMALLVADNAPHLCDDDGSARVYTHADPTEVARLELEIEQLRLSLTMNDCASVEDECVRTENRQLNAEIEWLRAENARLGGLKPEGPPRPPNGDGVPRYGLRWNGPQQPIAVPMDDGYWTPWHLADRLRQERDNLLEAGAHLL
jgi:hypothetical protein